MIAYLAGRVLAKEAETVVVEAGGVGYEVRLPEGLLAGVRTGTEIRLWVDAVVRSDAWELYGFERRQERTLFRELQRVPQVGARTALAIIDRLPPERLAQAVREGDTSILRSVKGIGAKSAQRIIVELRDRVAAWGLGEPGDTERPRPVQDAVAGLVALGYGPREAEALVAQVIEAGEADAGDTEALIRAALVRGEP